VPAAGLGEPPDEDLVGRVEEQDLDGVPRLLDSAKIVGASARKSPPRASMPSAARSMSARAETSSRNLGTSAAAGCRRVEPQVLERSRAVDLPAPETPVTTTSFIRRRLASGARARRPGPGRAALETRAPSGGPGPGSSRLRAATSMSELTLRPGETGMRSSGTGTSRIG